MVQRNSDPDLTVSSLRSLELSLYLEKNEVLTLVTSLTSSTPKPRVPREYRTHSPDLRVICDRSMDELMRPHREVDNMVLVLISHIRRNQELEVKYLYTDASSAPWNQHVRAPCRVTTW